MLQATSVSKRCVQRLAVVCLSLCYRPVDVVRRVLMLVYVVLLSCVFANFIERVLDVVATFIFVGHFGGAPQLLFNVLATLVALLGYFYMFRPLWWHSSATFVFSGHFGGTPQLL